MLMLWHGSPLLISPTCGARFHGATLMSPTFGTLSCSRFSTRLMAGSTSASHSGTIGIPAISSPSPMPS
jgi:hypothetical protein